MSNFKTAVMVVFLLAVLYGVYTVLHQPEPKPPRDFVEQDQGEMLLDIESGAESNSGSKPSGNASARRQSNSRSNKVASKSSERSKQSTASMKSAGNTKQVDAQIPDHDVDSQAANEFVPPPDLKERNNSKSRNLPRFDSSSDNVDKAIAAGGDDSSHSVTRSPAARTPDDGNGYPSTTSRFGQLANDSIGQLANDSISKDRTESRYDVRTENGAESRIAADRENFEGGNASQITTDISRDSDVPRIQKNPFVNNNGSKIQRTNGISLAPEYERKTKYQQAIKQALSMIRDQRWREALLTLSVCYETPGLQPAEKEELQSMLDPLAAKVIYSTEHLLESSYLVRRGERLDEIATKYDVDGQLLQNINDVADIELPTPGTQLKVVRGPFRAVVDLDAGEITIYLQRYYAGRFPISIGHDPEPIAGEFQVLGKATQHPYYLQNGSTIAGDDPRNPYGKCWIDLGRGVVIHGSPLGDDNSHLGCVSLSPKDARDLLAILSVGSKVTVR